MNTIVFPEVAESREKLDTAALLTLECGAIVDTLVGFQTVEGSEILVTSNNVTAIRTVFCVHPDMNLKAVRIQKCLATSFFRTPESVLPCNVNGQ